MKNVILTFGCDSWDAVERLIHDCLQLESGSYESVSTQLTRIEVEK